MQISSPVVSQQRVGNRPGRHRLLPDPTQVDRPDPTTAPDAVKEPDHARLHPRTRRRKPMNTPARPHSGSLALTRAHSGPLGLARACSGRAPRGRIPRVYYLALPGRAIRSRHQGEPPGRAIRSRYPVATPLRYSVELLMTGAFSCTGFRMPMSETIPPRIRSTAVTSNPRWKESTVS